jgi:DNA-binding beta-propeller fold protein YncE
MGKQKVTLIILILPVLVVQSAFYMYAAQSKTIWSFSSFGEDDYLYNPSDIEVDQSRSLIYVADSGNDRVLVFDFDGKLQKIIGRKGQGPGEFSNPTGLDVFDDGTLAVADNDNNRIQLFDKSWEFVKSINTKEVRVADLVFKDDKIYTISSYGMAGYRLALRSEKETQPLVNVLDQEGNLIQTMGVDDYPESQPFLRAIKHRVCLALSEDNKLFVPHFSMNVTHVFGLDGKKLTEFDRPLPFKPQDPKILQQKQSKEGAISMSATMDMVTREAKIGPDGNLYLLTFAESFMERSKGKDLRSLPPQPMRVDVIDTKTYELVRSIDIDGGATSFAVMDKNRLVYIYVDDAGEVVFKCIAY